MADGGDSGGPVFNGNSAYGIVSGTSYTSTYADLIFIAANYVQSGLSVQVLIE